MNKIILSTTLLATMAFAGGDMGGVVTSFEQSDAVLSQTDATLSEIDTLKARIDALEAKTNAKAKSIDSPKTNDSALKKEIDKLNKKVKRLNKKLNKVKAHDAFDNIKFSTDFRTAVDNINYDYNKYSYKGTNLSGTDASNDALITSRLYLDMKSAPNDKVSFQGQLAAYYIWGSHLIAEDDPSFKSWSASSKASDTLMRVRKAYFIYSDDKLPYSFSIGRRPSSDGFLINHRENVKEAGSPLAHITNMEVDVWLN